MKPAFSPSEIATARTMHAAGCSLKSIAAFLGRSKSGVANYVPKPDARNKWDAPPVGHALRPDLHARWLARLPAMRDALRAEIRRIVA